LPPGCFTTSPGDIAADDSIGWHRNGDTACVFHRIFIAVFYFLLLLLFGACALFDCQSVRLVLHNPLPFHYSTPNVQEDKSALTSDHFAADLLSRRLVLPCGIGNQTIKIIDELLGVSCTGE
jgi:hypothetical protein